MKDAEASALTERFQRSVDAETYRSLQALADTDVNELNSRLRTLGFLRVAERVHLRFVLLAGSQERARRAPRGTEYGARRRERSQIAEKCE